MSPASAVPPVVVIVDEDPETVASLCMLLRHQLPEVASVGFTSAEEAGRYVEGQRVDVLVVDRRLPGETGIAFLERMRHVKRDVPALLLTADPDPQVLADAVNRARVEGVFLKPIDEVEFVQRVRDLARRRKGSVGRIPS